MNWPAPIDARKRLPDHGQNVVAWCNRSKKWRAAAWFSGSGWSIGGYARQDVRWWYAAPPAPPEEAV